MNTRIAAGVIAFAAMFVVFAGNAQAEKLSNGKYAFSNNSTGTNYALLVDLEWVKDTPAPGGGTNGIYKVKTNVGHLSATSSDEGAKVDPFGKPGTLWQLHKNSNGWNFIHSENGANAVSVQEGGKYKLRRNNAGGKGNKDQLFQMEKGWN